MNIIEEISGGQIKEVWHKIINIEAAINVIKCIINKQNYSFN